MIERQWGNRPPLEPFVTELAQELMGVESEVACRGDHRQDALVQRGDYSVALSNLFFGDYAEVSRCSYTARYCAATTGLANRSTARARA